MASDEPVLNRRRKQLPPFADHSYCRASAQMWSPNVQKMDVYLRIHDGSPGEAEENKPLQVFHTVDNESSTLVIHSPPNPTEACNVGSQAFRYSKIFPVDVTQRAIYDNTVHRILDEFINGGNYLVLNYGTSTRENAVTMQGTATQPGLLMHTMESLFQRLGGKVSQKIKIKPVNGTCVSVGPRDAIFEHDLRSKAMKGADGFVECFLEASEALNDAKGASHDPVLTGNAESALVDWHYSVWVSCVEVYNELIYDLLDSDRLKRRIALRLCERCSVNTYVKDAREVCVFSAAEAIKLFLAAQDNLRFATKSLPEKSSQSHYLFTVKLISSKDGKTFTASNLRQLSFCNLAGCEKIPGSPSSGKSVTKTINASIIALGKCLETIRASGNAVIPYRESKLTRILQYYFAGRGHALMLVNINLNVSLFDETVKVLKFSALGSKVLLSWPLDFLAIPFRPTRCSIELLRQILTGHESESWISPNLEYSQCDSHEDPMQAGSLVILDEDDEEEAENENYSAKVKDLVELIHLLQQHLIQEKMDKMQLETDCRQELCSHFSSQIREMEEYYMDRIDAELDEALAFSDRQNENNKRHKPNQVDPTPNAIAEKDARITSLEAAVAKLNASLETALDSESEAQQRIASLMGLQQKAEGRIAELEAEVTKLTAEMKATAESENKSQELIGILQLRICKQQHQNNVNETLLNQKLNEATENLAKVQADLNGKETQVLQLENTMSKLQVAALEGVEVTNATLRDEKETLQRLIDSMYGKLKRNENMCSILSEASGCTASLAELKKTTLGQLKQCQQMLKVANAKIEEMEKEKTSLLNTLESFQKMLLKATIRPVPPEQSKARSLRVSKRELRSVQITPDAAPGSSSGSAHSSTEKADKPSESFLHLRWRPRTGNLNNQTSSGAKTNHETENRINNLEAELTNIKSLLKQALVPAVKADKLSIDVESQQTGNNRTLDESCVDSSAHGYSLRERQ